MYKCIGIWEVTCAAGDYVNKFPITEWHKGTFEASSEKYLAIFHQQVCPDRLQQLKSFVQTNQIMQKEGKEADQKHPGVKFQKPKPATPAGVLQYGRIPSQPPRDQPFLPFHTRLRIRQGVYDWLTEKLKKEKEATPAEESITMIQKEYTKAFNKLTEVDVGGLDKLIQDVGNLEQLIWG
jgi:hypothetical protein